MSLIPKVGRRKFRYRLIFVGIASFLWLGVALHLFPVYWAAISSIMDISELYRIPPTLFPQSPTLSIWRLALSYMPQQYISPTTTLPIALKNSLIVTLGTMAFQIPLTALAAYALSKLETPKWGRIMFLFFLGTMLVPGQISLIPNYLLIRNFPFISASPPNIPFSGGSFPSLNFVNTYWAVILPAVFSAFNILLFKGFFDTIPNEIINAARIDGASEFRIFSRIVLPLSKPVFAVVAYFSFSGIWNQFMWPLVVFTKKDMHPLALFLYILERDILRRLGPATDQQAMAGLHVAQAGRQVGYNLIMVIGLIQAIPLFIMFIILREQLMKGIKLRGFK